MHSVEDQFVIQESYYARCSWLYEAIRDRLGLKLNIHPDTERLRDGQIFLFNHFARFETIFPPYLIYRLTGTYTRSIGDHSLFGNSEWLDALMRGVGVVPNNQPGLLAFFAAEILRGRKVSVFPEGGMVKDRKVTDDDGHYGIQFPNANRFRGHHRGAAVLALTLDVFKQRILELHRKGDSKRINRWVTALGLDDEETLLRRAHEPTLIVPSTITFYPLGLQENTLGKLTQMFAKDIPAKALEELLVEGNLLLQDTDMDIRLNRPITPSHKWTLWERWLLNRYFLKINSLDDLFGLRERASSLPERLLARRFSKEATRLRNEAMAHVYKGVTLNLCHLASRLILLFVKRDLKEIAREHFHKALYLAIKNIQKETEVYLHGTLEGPQRYQGLLDGDCPDLDMFFESCESAGLIKRTPQTYCLQDSLIHEHKFHEVRLKNPIRVYVNESSTVPGVARAVENALTQTTEVSERELAAHMMDDEIRDFDLERQRFTTPAYNEVNLAETATQSGRPYFLPSQTQQRKGVLLVHGLLSSPAELRDFGNRMASMGFAVMGVRLAGHGTSPADLKMRTWTDWLQSVRRGYRILSAYVDQIVIVGFSAGASLSLKLASEQPQKLVGVAAVSAPLKYISKKLALVPLVQGLNKVAGWIPAVETATAYIPNESEHPDINYHSIPVSALHHLRALTSELSDFLPDIKTQVLIIQGDKDPVVDPDSASEIFDRLSNADKALRWISSKRHGILNEDEGGTCILLEDFITAAGARRPSWSRHDPPPQPTTKSVYALLGDAAARMPNRPCLDFMGKISTYGEVRDLAVRFAHGLQKLGIKKGDRVGLCLPNCPYYVIAYFGAMRAGATVVNFNPLYTEKEMHHQIIDSETRVMVTLDVNAIYPKVDSALGKTSLERIIVCCLSDALPTAKEVLYRVFKTADIADIEEDPRITRFKDVTDPIGAPEPVHIDPDNDIALFQYTGGTTGTPKGAMLTHANVTANAEQVRIWLGEVDPDGERMLCVLPFFHVFAMTAVMNLGISTGSELILLPKFELGRVLKTLHQKKATLFPAVPTIFNAILAHKKLQDYDLSAIRFCISGGAPLPHALKENFEALTGCIVVEGYGLTEASPVVSCNPADALNKTDSIGLPLPWTEIEIRSLEDPTVCVKTGERGQLAIKGPQVMKGYWQRPEATSDVIVDGWLMTGDVGHMDEDGYIFLTDRIKDVIICSGFNVYPRVIEAAFYAHPDLEEVTVIGVADDYRGETPMAFVKLKEGATTSETDLLKFVSQDLSPIERPSKIEIRDSLPKTMIGKLSKKELVAEVRAKQKGDNP